MFNKVIKNIVVAIGIIIGASVIGLLIAILSSIIAENSSMDAGLIVLIFLSCLMLCFMACYPSFDPEDFNWETTLEDSEKIVAFSGGIKEVTEIKGSMFLLMGNYSSENKDKIFYRYAVNTDLGIELRSLETLRKVYINEVKTTEGSCLKLFRKKITEVKNEKKRKYRLVDLKYSPYCSNKDELFYVFDVPEGTVVRDFNVSL